MKKHLPLDDFEREVQRLADGFEIQPRAMVFEQIRSEMAADTHISGKGKILKGIFSKSLHFISYAAAASVATIGSVLVYQQQESIRQQERTLSSFNKVQTTQSQTLTQRLSTTTDTLLFASASVEANPSSVVLSEATAAAHTDVKDQPVSSLPAEQTDMATMPLTSPAANGVSEVKKKTTVATARMNRTTVKRSSDAQANSAPSIVAQTLPTGFSVPAANATIETKASPANNPQQTVAESNASVQQHQAAPAHTSAPTSETSDSMATLPAAVIDTLSAVALAPDSLQQDTTGLKRQLAARNWLKKGVWSVAGFFTYEMNRTELQVPLSSDPGYYYETYRSFMNKTSRQGESFASGIKVDYTFLNHWGITSGLTYAQRKEYLSVDKHHEVYYNLVSSNWDVETITTAGYSDQVTNTFTYLEVPLLLNYTNTISGRFAFRLSAGMSYSYLMKQSASYVDMNNRIAVAGPAPVYHHSDHTGETPFRQHNVNMQLGAYVSYLVGSRMEVFAGPSFKRSLMSTFNTQYPFRQRFNATGGETGVRWFF